MTERFIRVVLDPSGVVTGGQRAERALLGVERRGITLQRVLTGVLGVLGVRQIAQYADTWTLAGNRLKLVTDTTENLNRVQAELFNVAQDTRQELFSVVELYGRAARSTQELGLTQRELIDFTRGVSQALQVSGATAQEATSGIIQFSQGLAKGKLDGDEFRSTLEQLPRVAQALVDGLEGINNLGELQQATRDLTVDRILQALQTQLPTIQREFEELDFTIRQGFTALENGAIRFVGRLNSVLNASTQLGDVLRDLGDFIGSDEFLGGVLRFGFSFVEAFNEIDRGAKQLRVSLENEFQFIRDSGMLTGEVLTRAFRDFGPNVVAFVRIAAVEVAALLDGAKARVEAFTGSVEDAVRDTFESARNLAGRLPGGAGLFDSLFPPAEDERVVTSLEDRLQAIADARFATIADILAQREEQISGTTERVRAALTQLEEGELLQGGAVTFQPLDREAERVAKSVDKLLRSLQLNAEQLRVQARDGDQAADALERLQVAARLADLGITELSDDFERALEGLSEARQELERVQAQAEDQELVERLREELELLQLGNKERAVEVALRELSADATQQQRDAVSELAGAIFEAQNAEETFNDFLRRARENAQDTLAGALADPFSEGLDELPFKFAQVLQQLAAEYLASEIFRLLGGIGSGPGAGGILSAIGNFFGGRIGGRQFGGGIGAGETAIVGEPGPNPELVTAGPGGARVIPLRSSMAASAMSAAPVVNLTNVNVLNVRDAVLEVLGSDVGREVQLNNMREERDQVQAGLRA